MRRCGTVLFVFLFEPKLRTKTSLRWGGLLITGQS
jgi:hypothetical protein